jgi:demethylmenaquinone methyltransferase/2-methoxy-6-polyprenyl-1,4-benzoquinol methylase
MSNVYYDPGEKRAEKVGDLFAAVAPRYDLINDLQSLGLHRLWKRRLVRLAEPARGKRALDVCCGTGDVAFRLARAGAAVTGVDFSGPMLEVAARRGRDWPEGAPAPGFVRGDALRAPFPDGAFDIVTISYGLRNLASLEDGLGELWRMLKPRGRFLALDFGKPPNPAWRTIYFAYLKRVVPLFGRLFCGCAETHGYILESLWRYPAQEGVRQRLLALGARDCRVINLMGGIMSIHLAVKPPK